MRGTPAGKRSNVCAVSECCRLQGSAFGAASEDQGRRSQSCVCLDHASYWKDFDDLFPTRPHRESDGAAASGGEADVFREEHWNTHA